MVRHRLSEEQEREAKLLEAKIRLAVEQEIADLADVTAWRTAEPAWQPQRSARRRAPGPRSPWNGAPCGDVAAWASCGRRCVALFWRA